MTINFGGFSARRLIDSVVSRSSFLGLTALTRCDADGAGEKGACESSSLPLARNYTNEFPVDLDVFFFRSNFSPRAFRLFNIPMISRWYLVDTSSSASIRPAATVRLQQTTRTTATATTSLYYSSPLWTKRTSECVHGADCCRI